MQLSLNFNSPPDTLVKLYGNGYQQPSIRALEDTLWQIFNRFHNVYIIIDSLDECTERRKLLKWFKEIAGRKSEKLHLLVTSRPEREIQDEMRLINPNHIVVGGKSVTGDIKMYIREMLRTREKWQRCQPFVLNEIETALVQTTGDM
jgi:hypothetical protein